MKLSRHLRDNVRRLRAVYSDCSDVIFHELRIGGHTPAMLVFIEGMIMLEELDQQVIAPLRDGPGPGPSLEDVRSRTAVASIRTVSTLNELLDEIADGHPVLLVDGLEAALVYGLSHWEQRSVEEPTAESVLRGPREGFIESLRTNIAMLRRKIRSPKLKVITFRLGSQSRTPIAVIYMEGAAAPALVREVLSRLNRIEITDVLETAYIEEWIEDNRFSPFPQLLSTERPDVAASYLVEGHVVIMVEGTPTVLVAPATFFSLLQTPEDYYERYVVGTAIRWLRYFFFAISLLGPSLYVAVVTFHQEMIPTTLMLTMARSREQIPFTALMEAFLMETMFEALREAGARLPKQIGSAVSIVGALVIGQAAISAGIVSAPMVMVVAITGIASFMAPRYTIGIPIRLLRFPIMFLAGMMGLLGVILGVIAILIHLLQLRSFGVPYMSPLAPIQKHGLKDVLFRAPRWNLNRRS
ncbi:MAG: hypothetical protein A9Z00_09580 [Thermobacillus sp. ZCTH02-B1]|uniref:spore germination protein n=1 Tax=Thermobacillus sp. ZCTH02-B1 TaxID=1858795 RepID=UPI000B570E39|nr:spore germination protein [Thermobacillus sp. ZCTH02-B1]OUM97515.1 MAG: hypothetical protein A9Z00_09580 [Thermobacillus sp. ZCTH02-B1]